MRHISFGIEPAPLKQTILALTAVILAAVLASCAVPTIPQQPVKSEKPAVSAKPQITEPAGTEPMEDQRAIYLDATDLFNAGEYAQAKEKFRKLVSTYPLSVYADNAVFHLGMIDFKGRDYKSALRYFQLIPLSYPDSENILGAKINSFICMFMLGNLTDAKVNFNQLLPELKDSADKTIALMYLADIDVARGDYAGAADYYRAAFNQAGTETDRTRLREKTYTLMHTLMSPAELETAAEKYGARFPADIALKELLAIYTQTGNTQKAESARARLDSLFPGWRESASPARQAEIVPVSVARPSKSVRRDMGPVERGKVKVGVILPLTGQGADYGKRLLAGIETAYHRIQSVPNGKNIELIIKDTQADPASAAAAIDDLASDRDAVIVLGPMYTKSAEAAAKIATANRIPVLTPSATGDALTGLSKFLFRTCESPKNQAVWMATLATESLGLKRFAIIRPADSIGQELSDIFSKQVESRGGKIVKSVAYELDQTDFGDQIEALGGMKDENIKKEILEIQKNRPGIRPESINEVLASKYIGSITVPKVRDWRKLPLDKNNFAPGLDYTYDAIFLPGFHDKVGLIMPELAFYNIIGPKLLGTSGINSPLLLNTAEKYAEGAIFAGSFNVDSKSPAVADFDAKYTATYNSRPDQLAAQGYDAANITFDLILQGYAARENISDALRSITGYAGVTGVISIGENGDAAITPFYLTVRDGVITDYRPGAESADDHPAATPKTQSQ